MKQIPETKLPASLGYGLIIFVFGVILISMVWGILDGRGAGPFWEIMSAGRSATSSTEAAKGFRRVELMWKSLLIFGILGMMAWGLNRAVRETDLEGRGP